MVEATPFVSCAGLRPRPSLPSQLLQSDTGLDSAAAPDTGSLAGLSSLEHAAGLAVAEHAQHLAPAARQQSAAPEQRWFGIGGGIAGGDGEGPSRDEGEDAAAPGGGARERLEVRMGRAGLGAPPGGARRMAAAHL
jgi:hypothetical protein